MNPQVALSYQLSAIGSQLSKQRTKAYPDSSEPAPIYRGK